MAKLFVVLSEWIVANDIDNTAIQCWTSLQEIWGINVCSIMSVMSGQLMPSACEVDVMGALSIRARQQQPEPASIANWNNNLATIVINACCSIVGTLPRPRPAQVAAHGTADIISTTAVGKENTAVPCTVA